ncbi:MAG TPA: MarR family transcriptional regulator [Microbacterium sp.]|nr:MarR family transcriptional regulator [Microbacterium sp.]
MTASDDLEKIIVAAHVLTRVAALDTRNEAPSAQWRTLAILAERGPLRVGDLAQLSRITQPGATRLVGTMAAQGLVVREPDPEDSRAVRVAATAEGERAFAAWRRQLATALLPRFDGLGDDEWEHLREAARILTARISPRRADDNDTKETAQ